MTCHNSISVIKLDGKWKFRQAGAGEWLNARVPGCVHTDLLRCKLIPDPFYGRNERDLSWIETRDWEYRREFNVPVSVLEKKSIELVAEGLDTVATITLNGKMVGRTANMFAGCRIPVGKHLTTGKNRLEIRFESPLAVIRKRRRQLSLTDLYTLGRSEIRKEQCSFGWDWGPSFPTSGIWRPIRLEAWSGNRIVDYHIFQEYCSGAIRVCAFAEFARSTKNGRVRATLRYDGKVIDCETFPMNHCFSLYVGRPRLWWPNGLGDQPLYEFRLELLGKDGEVLDSRCRRIALCRIGLEAKIDKLGRSFHFTVNGRPFFAKGANWIPAHSFVNEGEKLIPDLLDSAVEANMNMLRVWGGGIYESDSFYEGCLERGIVVWQDFMFACSLYPADKRFLNLVRDEVDYQVRRLRNYSNIAVWCGNNEIEQIYRRTLKSDRQLRADYEKLFLRLIPRVMHHLAPAASYISSSEHNPYDRYGNTSNMEAGDAHYWGVWHDRAPVGDYEKQHHRFFSEFGIQAYPCVETAATFTGSRNLFGPEMDNHQKNGGGNEKIFHYISSLYRFPRDYPAAVYLSQIMQAYCIRFGVEHMRRSMPRTMGALYWQLNDCWPVASWSSIDFGGRWKALHYAARRFFAPVLVSVKLIGEEVLLVGRNDVLSDVNGVEIHTVFDGPKRVPAVLRWELWSVGKNKIIKAGGRSIRLRADWAERMEVLDFTAAVDANGRNDLVLRTALKTEGYPESVNTTFLTAPKRIEFRKPAIKTRLTRGSEPGSFDLELTSNAIAYQVCVNLKGAVPYRIDDNFFDLFPGEKKRVVLRPRRAMTVAQCRKALTVYSYRDSYDA